jgi:hypothetical protein
MSILVEENNALQFKLDQKSNEVGQPVQLSDDDAIGLLLQQFGKSFDSNQLIANN